MHRVYACHLAKLEACENRKAVAHNQAHMALMRKAKQV